MVFVIGAEAHDPFDAGTVVPTSIEADHFAGGGEILDVALEVPLGSFAFGGLCERLDSTNTWIEILGDPLDRAAFSCSVATFEDHDNLETLGLNPLLELDQLNLEVRQLLVVLRLLELWLLGDVRFAPNGGNQALGHRLLLLLFLFSHRFLAPRQPATGRSVGPDRLGE